MPKISENLTISDKATRNLYLKYLNDFITLKVFAEYFNLSIDEAATIIEIGRALNNSGVKL